MRPSSKLLRRLLIAAGGLGLLVLGGGLVFDALAQRWMAEQLRSVSSAYLQPHLDFDDLDYHFPLSATLHRPRLVAEGVIIIGADALTLGLSELPSSAEPLRIESIEAQGLVVRVQATEDGVVGFSDFYTDGKDTEVQASDVFVLRSLELVDAEVQWINPGGDAMRLDGINGSLAIEEAGGSEPAAYELALRGSRGDLIGFAASANVNVDTLRIELESGELQVRVDEDTVSALPPSLQGLIGGHHLAGMFDGSISGWFPLDDPAAGALVMHAELSEFMMEVQLVMFSVEQLTLDMELADRGLTVDEARIEALGGQITLEGDVDLADESAAPARFKWNISGISLAGLSPGGGLAGRLDGDGRASANLRGPTRALKGAGRIRVQNGRLLPLPGLRELARAQGRSIDGRHDGQAEFSVSSGRVLFSELVVETPLLGFRGDGTLAFGGELDLRMRVGPLQKIDGDGFLPQLLRVGGGLMPYAVTGTVWDPKIRPLPLGIGGGR